MIFTKNIARFWWLLLRKRMLVPGGLDDGGVALQEGRSRNSLASC
jgi:hypothetical protein